MKKSKIICFALLLIILITVYNIAITKEKRKNIVQNERVIRVFKEKLNDRELAFRDDLYLLAQKSLFIDYSIIPKDLQNKPLLIYTYAGNECNKCILDDLEAIQSRFKDKSNVLILLTTTDNRLENIAKSSYLKGFRYKWCDERSITYPVNNNGSKVRYFSIIMPDSSIILPFFPNIYVPNNRDIYLDFVFDKIFKM